MYLKFLAILVALTLSVNSHIQAAEIDTIKDALKVIFQDIEIDSVEPSEIPGMYMVAVGAEIFYVSGDGKYLLRGDLIDLKNRDNLSEKQRTAARKSILSKVPETEFIKFAADQPQHNVFVFTDITCGFCQKLQHDIGDINARGITVNYLAFPRDGIDTVTSKNMESVWCAENRQQAFSDAMIGLGVDPANCENPVNKHYGLGQAVGVRGTPAIFTEDGRYLPGYLPPDELLKAVRNEK